MAIADLAPDERRRGRLLLELALTHAAGPALAAVLVGLLTVGSETPFEGIVLTFISFLLGGIVFRRERQHIALLPLTGALLLVAPAAFGLLALAALVLTTHVPSLGAGQVGLVALVGAVPPLLARRLIRGERRLRTAVIGLPGSGAMLERELELARVHRYALVGVIVPDGEDHPGESRVGALPVLGTLEELGRLVERNRIDLLLMTGSVSRLAVFDEMARSCLHLSVRLWELSGFYEEVFGHVPVAEINASWFQYIMHPRFNAGAGVSKRSLDLLLGGLACLVCLPLIALLALLVRRDGGPVLFRQVRIGEGGRPFTVYKLRTMRAGTAPGAQWAAADDPRVTRLGKLLRRTHLDELPQIVNVLRGDMSLVGPRPEQPEFVDRLEETIPFYSRRHLVRPGVTGWAQVRCGYAGSDVGSAWKLCHDLYYLKHRSVSLDLAIIAETLRTLVADRQYGIEPSGVSFIMRTESPDALHPHAVVNA